LSGELREKIRRRVKRHLAGEEVHRVTEKDGQVYYRIHGYGRVFIKRDSIGRIYIPRRVDAWAV
jgi:hypothetical protein